MVLVLGPTLDHQPTVEIEEEDGSRSVKSAGSHVRAEFREPADCPTHRVDEFHE
jgi:hypothetical protein